MDFNNETLLYQLKDDLQLLFNETEGYEDMRVKTAYDGDYEISYPLLEIQELDNMDVHRFYDGHEHVVDVGYQFTIMAEQTAELSAEQNVQRIINIVKQYMRGERYHALERLGGSPVLSLSDDNNIMIGYMRYQGRIDIDNNIIYRRN